MRSARPRLAVSLALLGLCGCATVFVAFPRERLDDPLTIALAICAICASTAYVPLDGKLLVDATFVPLMLAIAFLGPAPTFAIVLVSELGAWTIQRYRAVVVPINLFAVGGVALLGSAAFHALQLSPGLWFYLLLGAIGVATLLVNDVVVTSLIGILDGAPIVSRLREHLRLAFPLLINVALGVAVADIYANAGLEVIVFVLALILGFNYMARQTLLARQRTSEVEELAAVRGRLVSQTLRAEERERRVLAEALHDGAIQLLLSASQDLREAEDGNAVGVARARNLLEVATSALRDAVRNLHPSVVENVGLRGAVSALVTDCANRSGFVADVRVDPASQGVADKMVLSATRELVLNAARHSRAEHVRVDISTDGDMLRLQVQDDGVGFAPEEIGVAVAAGHIGLASLSERVRAYDGVLQLDSSPGKGTRVQLELPLDRDRQRAGFTPGQIPQPAIDLTRVGQH